MGVTRRQRLQEEFKRETSDILQKMKDPRIGFVSVTDAEISQDLRHVKIFVSVFGSDDEKERTLAALEHARGFVRTELGRRIRLRHTPEVVFRLDDSIERGQRINQLLRSVATEEGADEPR
ncbi:MAG: ribosome-binding factor A [Firmicutes bacterium ZCTH02-B6]|nr:MAG: ribosome-binding factor A [Firmicutes bacterium ZCTH02-B6]